MKISPLQLPGITLLELPIFRDQRGFFIERYNDSKASRPADYRFSARTTTPIGSQGLCGGSTINTQPGQGKLVGVIRGEIWDVVVDIRTKSPTYGKHLALELTDQDGRLLWIPAGFAHGFCVTGREDADVIYKVDQPYAPSSEGGILWSDPELAIPWPTNQPTVSERDQHLPPFSAYRERPAF